jgi:hypothetical protein
MIRRKDTVFEIGIPLALLAAWLVFRFERRDRLPVGRNEAMKRLLGLERR